LNSRRSVDRTRTDVFSKRPVGVCSRPAGTDENSPAFQRRENGVENQVPEGRLTVPNDAAVHPSRRGVSFFAAQPGVETPGYFQKFLRNCGRVAAMPDGRRTMADDGLPMRDDRWQIADFKISNASPPAFHFSRRTPAAYSRLF
jgi:hypothetical protein